MKTNSRFAQQDKCPFCDYKVDAVSCLEGDHKPSVGDISLCLKCAQILVFGENLRLREPTPEEYREACVMEGIKRGQEAIRMLDRRGMDGR